MQKISLDVRWSHFQLVIIIIIIQMQVKDFFKIMCWKKAQSFLKPSQWIQSLKKQVKIKLRNDWKREIKTWEISIHPTIYSFSSATSVQGAGKESWLLSEDERWDKPRAGRQSINELTQRDGQPFMLTCTLHLYSNRLTRDVGL